MRGAEAGWRVGTRRPKPEDLVPNTLKDKRAEVPEGDSVNHPAHFDGHSGLAVVENFKKPQGKLKS